MIRIHHTTPRNDGREEVTLACDCTPEHRIDFNVRPPLMGEESKVARRRLLAARVKNVRIMAEAGCAAAIEELRPTSASSAGSGKTEP